jgi:cytidylate kinase
MYLNDVNIETEIRTLEVSVTRSLVAEVSEVRAKLVEQQQEMGKGSASMMVAILNRIPKAELS